MDKKLLDYMNRVTDYYTKPNRYLAQDVVNMFLKKESKAEEVHPISDMPVQGMSVGKIESMGTYQLDMDEFEHWRNKNNSKFAIRAYLPISSHRKVIGKVIIFAKKAVRKCLKWYIEPIVEQQNEFNASATASINAVYNNDIVTNQFMREVKAQIEEVKVSHAMEIQELRTSYNHALQEITANCNAQIEEVKVHYNTELLTLRASYSEEIEALKTVYDMQAQVFTEQLEQVRQEIEMIQHSSQVREAQQEEVNKSVEAELKVLNTALKEESEQRYQGDTSLRESIGTGLQAQCELHERDLKVVTELVDKTQENINYLTYRMNKMKKEGIKVELIEAKAEIEEKGLAVSNQVELDYFLFENKFRGTEKSIKKNQEQYLEYYKNRENVLDIGCGRGEFLELLSENNIPAKGIDVYGEFVEYCQDKGMEVLQKDALSYVREQQDNSLGGIFMGQVAEHLENDYLLNLLASCYEKMQKGAYFISETPNPTNLSTFTNSFYLDPSHIKPVHPEAFKFMLEYVGFKDVEIVYTENSKSGYRIPLLNASQVANLEEFNSGINCISDMLLGSLDYAVIAKK